MKLKQLFPYVILMALDKRYYTHALPLAKHMKERFNIDIEIFLAGDNITVKERSYDHVDVPHAAPRLPGSSTYPTWLRPNAYNLWLCHNKALQRARERGYEQVLLLEDDVFFEIHTEEALEKLDTKIKAIAWDLLHLGFCAPAHRTDINDYNGEPNIVPAGRMVGGWQAIGIHSRIYDTLINFLPLICYDTMCDDMPNRYVVVPKLGEQRSGYSFLEQTIFARPECELKLDKLHTKWPEA